MYSSHRDIIDAWGTQTDFAEDIRASANAVKQMKLRDSIPWYYWDDVVAGAKHRRIKGITHKVLARLSPAKRGRQIAGRLAVVA